jgi:hypothetical protein
MFETRNILLPLASSNAYVSGLAMNCKQTENTLTLKFQLCLVPGAVIMIICEL